VRQEAAERRLLRRLDLFAQRCERRAAQPAQDVGVAPFALGAARTELAADELVRELELSQDRLVNGPRPFAKRWTTDSSGRSGDSRNASGSPPGGMIPSASR